MSLGDLEREAKAISAEVEALRARLAAEENRPVVAGGAAEAARLGDMAALERDIDAITTRRDALRAAIANFRVENEPGWIGRIARLPWWFGGVFAASPAALWILNALLRDHLFEPKLVFYETAAQVIPVLLLAAAVEARYFLPDGYGYGPAWMGSYVPVFFVTIVAGLVATFVALARGDGSYFLFGLSFVALFNCIGTLGVVAFAGPRR